jgi:sulfopyruvate decarboxylase TPP-binding subunit
VVSKFAHYRAHSELRNQNDTRIQKVSSVPSIPKFARTSISNSCEFRDRALGRITALRLRPEGARVAPAAGVRQEGSAMDDGGNGRASWQDALYDLLRRHRVTQFAYVPDAGHRVLIDRSLADPKVHSVALTTEEEGVALLAGADLGGARGVLLMQSSGAGNCINMLSLIKGGRFPFLTLVSMRGDFGEGNPWQFPMGQAVEPVLAAMGIIVLRVERPEDVVPTVGAALTMVFQSGQAVAVLLTQKLIGAKAF